MSGFLSDEVAFLAGLVPVAGARILDIGCGDGAFARRLLRDGRARQVVGLEADRARHAANMQSAPLASMTFLSGGGEAIPLPDQSIDVAVMIKSLHHVPLPLMDTALLEIRRVLVDHGHLYVSEPLYAGEFNEVMRLFHDEGTERAAAYSAIQRACQAGGWDGMEEQILDAELAFRDFDEFMDRMVLRSGLSVPPEVLPAVRARFGRSMTPAGARFVRQVRINLLRKCAESELPSTPQRPALRDE